MKCFEGRQWDEVAPADSEVESKGVILNIRTCGSTASSLRTAFGFAPPHPANYAEGKQAVLCKG